MRRSKDIIGKPVITLDEGRNVGQARDVLLSGDMSRLAGIFLGKEGLLRRKQRLIPSSSVVVYGIDAILIRDESAISDDKAQDGASDWLRVSKVQGREIDTPGGTRVGTVGDVLLDEKGDVTGIALDKVFVQGPIAESKLIDKAAFIDSGINDGKLTVNIAVAEKAQKDEPSAEKSTPAPAEPAPEPAEPSTTVEELNLNEPESTE